MTQSNKRIPALLTAACFALASGTASAGDAETGRQIFERWCTSCHASAGSANVRDAAPTLAAIVRKPSLSPDALKRWLANPHPPMPNLTLGRLEIENLVAYIESLRQN